MTHLSIGTFVKFRNQILYGAWEICSFPYSNQGILYQRIRQMGHDYEFPCNLMHITNNVHILSEEEKLLAMLEL